MMNAIYNASNPFQGKSKKVLCVCSAGLLRSPTAALVLSKSPYKFNTRAAGLEKEFALIPVTKVLLSWADEVVCMDRHQEGVLRTRLMRLGKSPDIVKMLDIPDVHSYRHPTLMRRIKEAYERVSNDGTSNSD